ncbi:MAG: 2-oxoglutarate dehydrogenase E1 component [Bacteroidia bacterium]|nr:2-oxoglutarate dehydrogenase E1 component [Bacteroidia bacterium]
MDKFNYLSASHINAIEDMYTSYLKDPNAVDATWQKFFEGFEFARKNFEDTGEIPENVSKEFKVINLIEAYRKTGHLFTKTNPVRDRRKYTPTLDIENFGLAATDLDTTFQAGAQIGIGTAKLSDIIAHLKQTYCDSIGVEYMYIRRPDIVSWLKERMEGQRNTPKFSKEEKKKILEKLNQAVTFENFLHTKFVGQKRFSLEGAEGTIPALDTIIEKGAELGVEDFVIGMAHRGRLNVLTNILGKQYKDIFTEFEGRPSEDSLFDGDVKYHLGYSSDRQLNNGKLVHLSLTPNPSHLEAVDPVVEGITRAKIDNTHNGDQNKVCPILIHGDAAVAAQGIVYEVLQMSVLEAYKTGGTVHLVINNQVGFTTNYTDARSSTYCTDIAKVVLSPVFHVNGDDVEALVYTCKLAMEFRQTFNRDVFIDVLCYRKYGHNEGDEPRFTQPLLYKIIANHPNPRQIYFNQLVAEGAITEQEGKDLEKEFKNVLQSKLDEAKQATNAKITSFLEGHWKGVKMADNNDFEKPCDTSISKETFLSIAQKITVLPKDKKFFNKIEKLFADRNEMIKNDSYDWAMGELMAYASLMNEGYPVRFSGQDVERGTFSHRHAVVKVEDSEEEYIPLNNIGQGAKPIHIYNSHLSEYGVLGFEYGYAFASPNILTIWEAQFGDFFNGAQTIVDQFISSAEAKWRRMNGLVVLLPHGYEGQGPEHSSGRLERFLQLCADNNMQIINATTPANQFHALRRQLKRDFRKPLICFTPKKLLRYPACVSKLEDFTKGGFKELIDDNKANATSVKRVIFCSGKIYYDLDERRETIKDNSVAIVRLEQLYPMPITQINEVIKKYKNAKNYFWAQEEPENMGAWSFVERKLKHLPFEYVGRPESASPATGYASAHNNQTNAILNKLFENAVVVNHS